MTELFLKKDGGQWQRVYFDTSSGGIKLTRENPYFTQSESYTFDITLPMEILENRNISLSYEKVTSKIDINGKVLDKDDNIISNLVVYYESRDK